MEGVLQGIPKEAVYLDNILVTKEEHLSNLGEVLRRMEDAGVWLKRSKCTLLADEVQYLGHKVDAKGLHTVKAKVRAVVEAPALTKAYLGLLNYYLKSLPPEPLYPLSSSTSTVKEGREEWCRETYWVHVKNIVASGEKSTLSWTRKDWLSYSEYRDSTNVYT
jgi:hypothetical protein